MDCTERQPGTGCHDRCEKYKAWQEKESRRKEAMRKENEGIPMSDAKRKAIWRSQRYSRKAWNPRHGPKK